MKVVYCFICVVYIFSGTGELLKFSSKIHKTCKYTKMYLCKVLSELVYIFPV